MKYLTVADIKNLHHTRTHSFYYDQQDRFEICKGKESDIAKDGEGTAMWYDTQLEAIISYNYYRENYKTVLLSDLTAFGNDNAMPSYCIMIDKKYPRKE